MCGGRGGILGNCIPCEVATDNMLSAVNIFKYIQVTQQALRCTSRILRYKMIKRKGITDASDILRQEGSQTVWDLQYESQRVSSKYYVKGLIPQLIHIN